MDEPFDGVSIDEVGSASGAMEASPQLSTAPGRRSARDDLLLGPRYHLPPYALQVTAWACLVPLVLAFALVFRLPMHAREDGAALSGPGEEVSANGDPELLAFAITLKEQRQV